MIPNPAIGSRRAWIVLKSIDQAFQSTAEQHIVTIEPADVGRRALADTLVDRGCLTSIRVATPAGKPAFKFLDDVDRLIRRPSIRDKNLDWQLLLKD